MQAYSNPKREGFRKLSHVFNYLTATWKMRDYTAACLRIIVEAQKQMVNTEN